MDFTDFEAKLWTAWVSLFVVNASQPGSYSWLPVAARNATQGLSLYGVTDLVYAFHAVGLLDAMPATTRMEWATLINGLQDSQTGWYKTQPWEKQNQANWPWHSSHAAVETLRLLGGAPTHSMTAVHALLWNESAWAPWMETYLVNTTNVWGGSQQAQCLPGIARSADPSLHFAFYDWVFAWLDEHVDESTGYWPGQSHDPVNQLGGAFHLYHLYSCFGREWRSPSHVVDAALASQAADGRWHPRGEPRTPYDHPSTCIDLDGVYALTRSARLVDPSTPYRWDDVRSACARYLRTVVAELTNASLVLGMAPGSYGSNSHLLHGPLYAIAECQAWFPDLVKTTRPWRRARGDALRRVTCAYA